MSKQVRCTPTSSIGELLAHMCIRCMAIPTPHSYLSYGLLSPMIVLIDVSLSHTFLSSSSTLFLVRLLGVNFLAHAHPLHECSIYRKGVDQFDLYLASGLGTSPDKNPKETLACVNANIDSCLLRLELNCML